MSPIEAYMQTLTPEQQEQLQAFQRMMSMPRPSAPQIPQLNPIDQAMQDDPLRKALPGVFDPRQGMR